MMTIADDVAFQQACGAARETAQALAEAERIRLDLEQKSRMGNAALATFDLDILVARQKERRAREAHEDRVRAVAAVRLAARARVLVTWQPEDHARLQRLVEVAETAHREALEYRAHQEARAAAVGDMVGEHPVPQLLGLGDTIDKLRARLDGRAAARERPEPMIRFRVRVHDTENSQYRLPGDLVRIGAFGEDVLKSMLERNLVEHV